MADLIITKDFLLTIFEYKNGELYWKIKTSKNTIIGSKAGSLYKNGYFVTTINYKRYYKHRLIYMMHHGYMPKIIDHIDNNSQNNKIENLRNASSSQNMCNQKIRIDNKSGAKGIGWHKIAKKWRASIRFENKQYHLGLFDNINDAKQAISLKRIELHTNFARHS